MERRPPGSRQAPGAAQGRRSPAEPGQPQDLLRLRGRRGQDLRHARRRPAAWRRPAWTWSPATWSRMDDRRPRSCSRVWRCCHRSPLEYHGLTLRELDLDAALARHPAVAPGRRTGPHQRPRFETRQALAGRAGAAGRGHQRLHHPQRPAPREPQRHHRRHNRRAGAGDGARHGLRQCRLGRGGGSASGRAGRTAAPGQSLHPRPGRTRRAELLHPPQPGRAARDRPAAHRRPGPRPSGDGQTRLRRAAADLGHLRDPAGVRGPQPHLGQGHPRLQAPGGFAGRALDRRERRELSRGSASQTRLSSSSF